MRRCCARVRANVGEEQAALRAAARRLAATPSDANRRTVIYARSRLDSARNVAVDHEAAHANELEVPEWV